MNNNIFISAFLCCLPTLGTKAQQTPLQKYEIPPAEYQHVYLDHVEYFNASLINSDNGQYVGQTDSDGHIYGYGSYISNEGNQRIGLFRKDEFMFGITLNNDNAIVGSNNHYAVYSLTTGELLYVFKSEEKQLVDAEGLGDYAFVSLSYRNGDRYVGETYKGKRHGYGVYYYANGSYWYGQYRDDVRYGFGAKFLVDNDMEIGFWKIEDTPRLIKVDNRDKPSVPFYRYRIKDEEE
ncbi:MAG: hypothetical protein J6B92_06020 [Paraprevotella sp.]|nr:hypothetical protein [Paraprevotella sp.]